MKKFVALLLALTCLFSLAACGGGAATPANEASTASEPNAEPQAGSAAEPLKEGARVLRVGSIEASQSYSPTDAGSLPLFLAYEYLSRYNADGSISLWCAESIEWRDDTTLAIKLRDDVYFNNGEQMIGEDVLYSLYYAAHGTGSVLGDKLKAVNFDKSYVEDDGMTTVLVLDQVYSVLPVWLPKFVLTDKSAASERASDDSLWWDHPISSSAYEIVENVDGSHVTFRLREDYWDKENMPQWDEIVFNYYSNATAMFIAFENGELDLVYRADVNDYERALAGDVSQPDTTATATVSTNSAIFLILGGYCEDLDDIKVREAIAHAIDPNAIGTVAYGDLFGGDLDSAISKIFDAYVPQGQYSYDVEYAKQCMAESTHPDGFELTAIANVTDTAMWEVLQAELAEIGITLNVESFDFATMISKQLTPGATDIAFFGGSLSSFDPYDTLSPFHDENFITGSRVLEPEFNEMYDRAPTITDKEEQNALYADMQKWIYENYRLIPLFEPYYCVIYNDSAVECNMFDVSTDYIQYSCLPVA